MILSDPVLVAVLIGPFEFQLLLLASQLLLVCSVVVLLVIWWVEWRNGRVW